jgi:hypothetical protein
MSQKKTPIVIEEREDRATRCEDDHSGHQSPKRHLLQRVQLTGTRRISCVALQNALAAGILMFYSKTILGTVIRTFVGA